MALATGLGAALAGWLVAKRLRQMALNPAAAAPAAKPAPATPLTDHPPVDAVVTEHQGFVAVLTAGLRRRLRGKSEGARAPFSVHDHLAQNHFDGASIADAHNPDEIATGWPVGDAPADETVPAALDIPAPLNLADLTPVMAGLGMPEAAPVAEQTAEQHDLTPSPAPEAPNEVEASAPSPHLPAPAPFALVPAAPRPVAQPASAAERIAAAPLEDLSHVELVERLAIAIGKARDGHAVPHEGTDGTTAMLDEALAKLRAMG